MYRQFQNDSVSDAAVKTVCYNLPLPGERLKAKV